MPINYTVKTYDLSLNPQWKDTIWKKNYYRPALPLNKIILQVRADLVNLALECHAIAHKLREIMKS